MGCNLTEPTQKLNLAEIEDQVDYQFIQRIIQEVTQSCALPLPMNAAAIPPLIIQAAQWFWQNDDYSSEERFYVIKNEEFQRCQGNKLLRLPDRIISIAGVYKCTDSFAYGALGDFSLERMIVNNSALATGVGGNLSDMYGTGTGYNLTDIMAALYEVQTFKAMFDVPLTYTFNEFSHILNIMGALKSSDVVIHAFVRCKIQDLYQNFYFFRFCCALCKKSMGSILGTFEYKLPGGITMNVNRFWEQADKEEQDVKDWVKGQHTPDYFINSNTI